MSDGRVTGVRDDAEVCVVVDQPLDPLVPLGCSDRYTFLVAALARKTSVKVIFVGSRPASVDGLQRMKCNVVAVDATSPDVIPRGMWGLWVSRAKMGRHILLDRFPLLAAPRIHQSELLRLIGAPRRVVILGYRLMHLALALPMSIRPIVAIEEAAERYRQGYFEAGEERWRRLAWRAETRKTQSTYRRVGRRAAAVVAISETEAEHFKKFIPHATVHVVPHGIDLDFFRAADDKRHDSPIDVLVVGDFNSPCNAKAVHQIYEEYRRSQSGQPYHWAFVGLGEPPVDVQTGGDVEFPGRVRDVRPYYSRARIVLVPAWRVTGVKTTLLQAWAMERPVVASPAAAASVGGQDGVDLLVGATPGQVCQQIKRMLGDSELREKIARNGAGRVRQERDLSRVAELFANIVLTGAN